MTLIVALFNQAGGVGKTTLTQNLGYHLHQTLCSYNESKARVPQQAAMREN